MARFDFRRRRRAKDGPPRLGLVVAEKAVNSEELMLRQELELAIMREAKGNTVIFEADQDELANAWDAEPDYEKGEDPAFLNQKDFTKAMGWVDQYPSQLEALAWLREIEARAFAIWWPQIEAAQAKGPDGRQRR